jgi:cell division protein FtsW
MSPYRTHFDYVFLAIVCALVVGGFLLLVSASLGLHAREGLSMSEIVLKQGLWLIVGIVVFFGAMKIPIAFWKKYSFYIFFLAVIASLLVFIPGLGLEHAGAKRWLMLGPISFQPAEFLKLSFVVYFAALVSSMRSRICTFRYGFVTMLVLLAIVATVLLAQPDTGTLIVIVSSAVAMFIAGGGKLRHVGILVLVGIIGLFILSVARPYVMDRITTFVDPARDPQGAGYQIQQSLISVGSGGITGRGFGQSIQKFKYLPEPVSDSIFAVAAEEFGFVGSFIIISLFLAFTIRGFNIAERAPNRFSGLMVTGIVILVISQSLINIGSMIGVFPLTGMPLLFVSNGGTALVFTLLATGIIMHVSAHKKNI